METRRDVRAIRADARGSLCLRSLGSLRVRRRKRVVCNPNRYGTHSDAGDYVQAEKLAMELFANVERDAGADALVTGPRARLARGGRGQERERRQKGCTRAC